MVMPVRQLMDRPSGTATNFDIHTHLFVWPEPAKKTHINMLIKETVLPKKCASVTYNTDWAVTQRRQK